MEVVGTFLVVIGCLFIVLSGVTVLAQIVSAFRPGTPAVVERGLADELNAAAGLVAAIGKLPPFLITALLGLLLIAAGQHLQLGLLLTRW